MFPRHNSPPRHHPAQGNANVKVVVRVRPLNEAEQCDKYHVVTEAISDHMLVFDPKIQTTSGFLLMSQRDINRRRFKDLKYAFDYVFGPSATNKDVFEKTTKGIVSGVLNGYNCSVFAYGATGAGKTHTMLGNEREPGVIYYTMIDLYRRINEQKDEKMFDVAVSYSEVYNEQVRDLLMPRGNLPIREDKNVGVIIAGLSLHKPKTADELLHMLQFGNKNRTQHPTDANAESSRSHAVFQVFVNQREKSASVSTEVRMAKMCLVDLAGSERANHSTNCGARFREGANINRSLLALGNVINALADNKFKGHIPYRDSKLTRLLKDSLGGNCQTVMIAAVSPSSRSFEDTYNTLRYADRAKHIRADVKKNVMSIDFHIANYKKYVKELEKENQELRRAKQKLADTLENMGSATPAVSPIIRQFQERLKDLFRKRKHIRKSQMESEGAKRELKWKVARKEQSIKRVQHLTGTPNVIAKHKRIIERMKRRILKEEQALKDSSRIIQEHDNAILNTYTEIGSTLGNGKEPLELLELNVRIHTIEANMYDSHMYLAFVKKMARAQERQSSVNERLISCLIQLVKKQHDILHSQDLLNNELKMKYEQCCYLVEERGVAWTSPVVEQERSASKHQWEENEEFCISDIIDIQIPKLHMQAFQLETTPSKNKERYLQQPPQRVLKPMSAVKPAARVISGQYFSTGDRNMRQSSSPSCYTIESGDASNSQHMAGESLSEKESNGVDAPGMNPVDVLNASFDMCPKRLQATPDTCPRRLGVTPERMSTSPPISVSASGISFGADEPPVAVGKGQTKPTERKSPEVTEQNINLCPSSSMPAIDWGLQQVSKLPLWRNCSHPLTSSAAKLQTMPVPEEEENSGVGNLNDTFQIQKPAFPSTYYVDNSSKVPLSNSTPQPQNSISRSSPSLVTTRRLSSERIAVFQKPDAAADGKRELVTNSPVSRYQTRLSNNNHAATAWGPAAKPYHRDDKAAGFKRPSIDNRAGQSKLKPASHGQIRTVSSPHGVNSVSGRSLTSSNPNYSSMNSSSSTGCDEKHKSELGFCVNSNNVNAFTSGSVSPKTYADVVKSPVVARLDSCSVPKLRPTAMISHWKNEAVENVMRTPDFSTVQCSQLVASVLEKPPDIGTVFAEPPGDSLCQVRQPLKALSNNSLRLPALKSISSAQGCSLAESTGQVMYKSQLKVRPVIDKVKQTRAAISAPYSVHNRRQERNTTIQKLPTVVSKANFVEVTSRTRPNYMLSTFARSQKMQGIAMEKPFLLKNKSSLSQRILTNQQPFTTSWNKGATVTDAT